VASALLLIGPGSLFVAFMPCRFTTSLSENYFNWLLRTGAAILGFFIVLSTCQHFAVDWTTKVASECGATLTTAPSPILGALPKIVSTTACTKPIPTDGLATLFVDALLVAVMGLGIPTLMAAFAGSGIHLALEHLAAARYLGGSAMRSMVGAVKSLSHQIQRMRESNSSQTTLQERVKAGAAASARVAASLPPLPPTRDNPFGIPATQPLNGRPKPTTRI